MRGLAGLILLAGAVATLPAASQGTPRSCADGLVMVADLPVPPLLPPPGATTTSFGEGVGGSTADFRCHRRFDTKLEPAALADHFETQMTEKGWRIADRSREDTAMAVTLFAGSVPTTSLTGLLIITALEGTTAVDVVLRIVRHDAPGDDRIPITGPGRGAGRAGGGGAGAAGTAAAPPMTSMQALLNQAPLGSPGEAIEMRERLPDSFPGDLLPRGADVKLVAVSPSRTTVVAVAPGLTPYQIPSTRVDLYGKGWLTRRPGSGFVSDASMVIARPDDYCRGDDTATVSFQYLSNTMVIRASHARAPGRPCVNTPAQSGAFSDVPMPLLVAPAPVGSGGAGGALNVFDGSTRVQSTLAAGALGKTFAEQLGLGGWKVVQQAHAGEYASIVRARNTTAAGDPVTALVATTALSGTPRVVLWLHVVRHKPVSPSRGGN